MREGLVVLLEANRPTVALPDGTTYLCYLKGRIKRDVGRIMVGDRVLVEPTDPGEARIETVLPRTTQLLRPPVANVQGVFVVFSLESPAGSLELLDKRLVMAALSGLEAEVVLSKVDLATDQKRLERIAKTYGEAGYRVWRTSAPLELGIEDLIHRARQGIWVLTGESGAGKSTLLKAMIPTALANTGELSRIGRGQQTTRWVRLYAIDNYWLADSPGYTALETQVQSAQDILAAFPELAAFNCRFHDCLHRQEPGCLVHGALEAGEIADWRYQHYLSLLDQWIKRY
ncbi:ribosome small subunit-dependent GTPase A [Sulfobacillus harzensis]|uniref:Small ribosomal subunit biogenesis GTPase RsgA n=1 Tax=Sulfobacillus harzensis TaxID=2729629 RepID=A0A7Y0L3H1_9FIRM|nr:ribosome small subunit-dependent GTPase A [Sulfobacillus harzensis]NMP22408.1 ribosome small subunit-dependent GTPase A [Sulfobacillus harzensis]